MIHAVAAATAFIRPIASAENVTLVQVTAAAKMTDTSVANAADAVRFPGGCNVSLAAGHRFYFYSLLLLILLLLSIVFNVFVSKVRFWVKIR
ncbi:unnamed protein product [Acanthoscelides obtectus]|uniref:Uncharacterized protein n=1 Tax=Acanthoscelides obtectus TaxID=200917 RepID=A0A9P0PWE3_ACAOB|nr:unnamed protein product [Acanthoscelides obtectus]CAK1659329.1 hypothetical protein AOBTE_LOCUS21410 [Acanthoscelides obtectus]